MFTLSIRELDLLEFFGSTHVSRCFGTEWFDSDSLYRHQQPGGITVTCAIMPIHKDARITLSVNSETVYDWQVTALADIKFDREQDCLSFTTQSGDLLTLCIRPSIVVRHNCKFLAE
ncbi:MAG: hypothetical protein JNK76_06440 [Planctomycetales bacterium]|nr:hypothetical protein [Planctomycetales bacterium]MBN8627778.1 hypothetical protein [Planctomycetota bacterium]